MTVDNFDHHCIKALFFAAPDNEILMYIVGYVDLFKSSSWLIDDIYIYNTHLDYNIHIDFLSRDHLISFEYIFKTNIGSSNQNLVD